MYFLMTIKLALNDQDGLLEWFSFLLHVHFSEVVRDLSWHRMPWCTYLPVPG